MATITISITDVHMDGHDDTEREVQACVEDSVGMIEAAIENALTSTASTATSAWRSTHEGHRKESGTMQYPIECRTAAGVLRPRVRLPGGSAAPPTVADPGGHHRGLCRGDRPGDCGCGAGRSDHVGPSTITSTVAAPPTLVTQVSTVTLPRRHHRRRAPTR